MSDFTELYTKLLILQYCDKTKAVGEIAGITALGEKIFDIVKSFETEFDIDTAYGHRLDLIGKLVGIDRIVSEGIAKTYFGWAGITNAATFGEAPMYQESVDSAFADTQLTDIQMRFFIKAKVAKNVCAAFLTCDDNVSLQDAIDVMFDSNAIVVDNQDMTLTLLVNETYTNEQMLLLQAQDLLPKPQGVRYKLIIQYNSTGTFGFEGMLNVKTFGAGAFARLVLND